jgi:1-acyl-sn-glycerol-3-phosphate acyltransferase
MDTPDGAASRGEIAAIVAQESAETLVGSGRLLSVTRRLLAPAAHLMARRFVEYDRALGDRGTHRGAAWIVARATGGVTVTGAENVPANGPLLVVANHPGLADAVSILATVQRDDAWLVAADFPFLRALRRANRRFLFVDDRCTTLRHIVRRLRDGDAVLLFPAGGLEPDPGVAPERARDSLATWSRSTELIGRLVEGARIVPALVSGAVSRSAFDHPLARRRSPDRERQRLASLLQLAVPAYQHQPVVVRFGAPIAAATPDVHGAVLAAMTGLMSA